MDNWKKVVLALNIPYDIAGCSENLEIAWDNFDFEVKFHICNSLGLLSAEHKNAIWDETVKGYSEYINNCKSAKTNEEVTALQEVYSKNLHSFLEGLVPSQIVFSKLLE